jgi:hypothetical protein
MDSTSDFGSEGNGFKSRLRNVFWNNAQPDLGFVCLNQCIGNDLVPPKSRWVFRSTWTSDLCHVGAGRYLSIKISCLGTYAQADCLDDT